MTRARNLAGLSTVTAQPTTTTPVHLGPLGVVTATRYYGTFDHTNIVSASVATTSLVVSGITTGLNVSGIITSQNGIIVSGVSTFLGSQTGLNVTGVATFAGNVSIAGTLTYEDVTDIDSVGIVTARQLINAQGQVHVGTGVSIKAGGLNVTAGIVTITDSTESNSATTGAVKISGGLGVAKNIYTSGGLFVQGSGGLNVTNTVSIGDSIVHTGDTNTSLRFPAADTITAETAGIERIRIDSSGRLLVGRTSGSFMLDVSAGSDSTLRINNTNETGHGSHDAKLTAGGTYYQNPNIVGSAIKFSTYDGSSEGERVRITSAGNVGIASQSPTYKLDVSGITRITNDADNTATNMGTSGALSLHNLQDAKGTFIDFIADSANGTSGMMAKIGAWNAHAGSGYSGELTFSTRNASNMIERLRIRADGNVNLNNDLNVVGITTLKGKVGLDTTGALNLPQGTTSERPSDASSSTPYIRWNTTNSALEVYNGSNWVEIITDYFPTGSTFFN